MAAIAIYQDTVLANTVPEPLSRPSVCDRQFGQASGLYWLPARSLVSPATSIADWRDQTVCHKETGSRVVVSW